MGCLEFHQCRVGVCAEDIGLVAGRTGARLCQHKAMCIEELLEREDVGAGIPELMISGEGRCLGDRQRGQ